MAAREVGIRDGTIVVLKPFGDRHTLRARLFRVNGPLSPGAAAAELGVWPGYAIFETSMPDGLWNAQSTADIERLAPGDDLHRRDDVEEDRPDEAHDAPCRLCLHPPGA
jgi:hypothetical protein